MYQFAQEPLGLVDIPAGSIVGTKTSGLCAAANFMPLLEEDTEFAIQVVESLRRPIGEHPHPLSLPPNT